MRAARKGMTFVYTAGALAFTLIMTVVAQMLVASLLITGGVIVFWPAQ